MNPKEYFKTDTGAEIEVPFAGIKAKALRILLYGTNNFKKLHGFRPTRYKAIDRAHRLQKREQVAEGDKR